MLLFLTNTFSVGLVYGISVLVKKLSINLAIQIIPFLFYVLCFYMIYAFFLFVFSATDLIQKKTTFSMAFVSNLLFHFVVTFIALPILYYALHNYFLLQIALGLFAENRVYLESLGMDFNSFFNLFMKSPDENPPTNPDFGDHTIVGGTKEDGTKYMCASVVKVLDTVLGEDTASRWLAEKAKDVMGIPDHKCWEYEKKN
jgi:hypothetical protein